MLSAEVQDALAAASRGVSAARAPAHLAVRAAACAWTLSTLGSTNYNFTVCPSEGLAWRSPAWSGEPATAFARSSAPLDALLSADAPGWARTPLGARLVSTSHYVSEATACGGDAPFVLRVHHYCADDGAGESLSPPVPTLRPAGRKPRADHVVAQPTWAAAQPSVEDPGTWRCELDAFFALPALCGHGRFGDGRPARLARLLDAGWGALERSGYTLHGGGEPSWNAGGGGVDTAAVAGAGFGRGASSSAGSVSALTYGELSAEGTFQLLDLFRDRDRRRGARELAPGEAELAADDTFVDVGSGVGKLVAAVAMLTPARSVGIEYVAERAERADAALADAARAGLLTGAEARRVDLRQGDATAAGAIPHETTHAFLSNLCFSRALNGALLRSLASLPRLRCVASLRELPLPPPPRAAPAASGSARSAREPGEGAPAPPPPCELAHAGSRRVRASWDDAVLLHVYCCKGK